jgi:flagellar hook-basal body complex protein FliE
MDIKTNSLLAQMQQMSMQASGNKPPSIEGDVLQSQNLTSVNSSGRDFGDMLSGALQTVHELQQESGAKKVAFEMGDRSITLADVMTTSAKSGIALDAAVQVRNKFVEAYKEIMSMPV